MDNNIYMENLYALNDKVNMSKFILAHLGLESLLDQLVVRKLDQPNIYKELNLRFAQKNLMVQGFGYYDVQFRKYVSKINSIRNKFSHNLEFDISFDDAFDLVNLAHEVGIEFSDDNIWCNRIFSEEYYGVEGILEEVMGNTNVHIALILEEVGGIIYW